MHFTSTQQSYCTNELGQVIWFIHMVLYKFFDFLNVNLDFWNVEVIKLRSIFELKFSASQSQFRVTRLN